MRWPRGVGSPVWTRSDALVVGFASTGHVSPLVQNAIGRQHRSGRLQAHRECRAAPRCV